ncbi:retinoic acid-induced protein 3 [Centropristis striata]|uniref:retinoic acid-induced protein 3 n=1 Tax=Centropristis striata TaxID=184440 RepID=UPI0027E18F00|nr:retinoic acid-induced protein 3 [Centropristis striata]XP_059204880.1 retinoic acid-induced protein 3 [Centropristis striata]
MSMAFLSEKHKSLFPLLLLLYVPLTCLCQSTNSSSINATSSPSSNGTAPKSVHGCGRGLNPIYRYLCDRRAAWGIILETLASSGFLFSMGLLLGMLFWSLWICVSSRNQRSSIGGTVACMSLFLLATAGIFAITFSFIIRLTPQTCPTRIFLFSVLFSLAFSCLLARCLALLGFAAARGWGEPALALGLFMVQVIISTQWLILVLVRDKKPCAYSPEEFAMLQIYVLILLAISLILSLHYLCRSCFTYSYSYGAKYQQSRAQATLLFLTLLLSACIWVVWITMLVRGNPEVDRRPQWNDPVLSIALVTNGWVLLMGYGLSQIAFFCRGEAKSKDIPLSFAGWTSPSADIPGLASPKEGKENGSFESESDSRRGRRTEQSLRSPYESGFSVTDIDPDKDYTIPRPQTTNYLEPYDEY